jgi:plastocyanin
MVSHPFLLRSALLHYSVVIASLSFISLASWSVEACAKKNISCVQVQVNNVKNIPLENMVVYLEPLAAQVLPQQSETVNISQHSKSFIPYISVSQSTAKVSFENKDDITHHIYSADSENKFSFKIRAGKTDSTTQFNHAAEIAMGCNIHDWMSGYLLVVDTPYFTKTDAQGIASFTMKELGKYRVVVWHPQLRTEKNRIIKEKNLSTDDTITFTLKQNMDDIPAQKSDDDFDFLSDY